jgi:hypothetical protein
MGVSTLVLKLSCMFVFVSGVLDCRTGERCVGTEGVRGLQNLIPDAAHVPEVSDFKSNLTMFGTLWSFVQLCCFSHKFIKARVADAAST